MREPCTKQPELPAVLPKLVVEHNHGILVLKDAVVYREHGYRYVEGTVVDGGQTSRLFSATHYTPFETGVLKSWCIGSSWITPRADGGYNVSAVFF